MASISDQDLDETVPDVVYQCISLIDADSSKREDCAFKCPLCNRYERNFFCVDCVRNGNFTHTKNKSFERFADKKPKKYKLDEQRTTLLLRYEEALSQKKEIENVKFEIQRCKSNIELLKKSIQACKSRISKEEGEINQVQEKKVKVAKVHQKLAEKMSYWMRYNDARNSNLEFARLKLNTKQSALQEVIHRRIKELLTHIFPITKTSSHLRDCSVAEEAELEEAQKTTYIQGQWVITKTPMDDLQYMVVEPTIPSTGDYSAYTAWCADHEPLAIYRGDWPSVERHRFDVAYGISSALAFAAQFVNIIAFYLDVHVPKRSSFNDFCRYEDATKFSHHVAKLNANIVHLCLHRQVDVAELSAHRTISNLCLLLEPKRAERRSITQEEKEELLESLEDSITKDLLPLEESDDDLEEEFVHVSTEEVPDIESSTSTILSAIMLPSVVTSFYKTFTGRK